MPLFEYVLLALLGSGATGTAPANTTLSADAVVQPNGGALSASISQDPPKKDDSRRNKVSRSRRHRHRRHPIRHPYGKDKKGSKVQ